MRRLLVTAAIITAISACAGDQSEPITNSIETVESGGTTSAPSDTDASHDRVGFELVVQVDEPIDLRQRPGTDTIYVASRLGRIHAVEGDELDDTALVDISGRTEAVGEQGLLGFAFSPDGSLLYLHFTDRNGDSTVEEYVIDGDRVDPSSRRTILVQPQPFPNHNGGSITFGPDGMLYVGLGDGGSGGDPQGNGQALDTWLGKLLRIDPNGVGDAPYDIPPGNPFAVTGGRPEIWSWGLRNPWRFSFDRETGDLWVADVGQNEIEEVTRSSVAQGAGGGVNFGWRRFEGDAIFDEDADAPGAVGPTFTVTHSADGACSITGGFVYRGSAAPLLQGAYLFTDLCWTGVRAWWPTTRTIEELGGEMSRVVSFGEDLNGELYVLSFDGAVYRIV